MYNIYLTNTGHQFMHRCLDYAGALHWVYTIRPMMVTVITDGKPLVKLVRPVTALVAIVRHHERTARLLAQGTP